MVQGPKYLRRSARRGACPLDLAGMTLAPATTNLVHPYGRRGATHRIRLYVSLRLAPCFGNPKTTSFTSSRGVLPRRITMQGTTMEGIDPKQGMQTGFTLTGSKKQV